jgi:hypothetical protein
LNYITITLTMTSSSTSPSSSHVPAPFTRLITTHSSSSSSSTTNPSSSDPSSSSSSDPGPAVTYHTLSGPAPFQSITPGTSFSLIYTSAASPVIDTQGERDVAEHEKRHDSGNIGLVYPGGTVCRVVEWAPLAQSQGLEDHVGRAFMHRTESLDYGIVLFGEGT